MQFDRDLVLPLWVFGPVTEPEDDKNIWFDPPGEWQTVTTMMKTAMNPCHALVGFLGSPTPAVSCKVLPY